MGKKVKLPRTRLSIEMDRNLYDETPEYTLWFYVDGFRPMVVHTYSKRSDALRGAMRFGGKICSYDRAFGESEDIPIFVDGSAVDY